MTDSPAARTPEGRPADRYGPAAPSPLARTAVVALGLLLAAVLAWWVWVAAVRSTPPLRWEVVGFDGVTNTSVDIRWVVRSEPAVDSVCILRARNDAGEEVGRDRVDVPARAGATEMVHTLRTSDRPATGEVLACVLATD